MKLWMKIIVAVVGSGLVGGLTFLASQNPTWGQVCTYGALAVSGAMSIAIGWPPKT